MPYLACWRAAKVLHAGLLENVLRTPLQFFDVTPIGRILSRFSKDVDVLDTSLPSELTDVMYCAFEVTRIFYRVVIWVFIFYQDSNCFGPKCETSINIFVFKFWGLETSSLKCRFCNHVSVYTSKHYKWEQHRLVLNTPVLNHSSPFFCICFTGPPKS